MRWPIRYQIFVPFAALVLAAVASIAVTMAVLAARRSAEERIDQLHRVESTLADAGFPFTRSVLRKMRGLSGAEFVALDENGAVVTSTFDRPLDASRLARPVFPPPVRRNGSKNSIRWHLRGSAYFAAVLPGKESSGVASLLILYPQQNLRRARWEAAWPPLAVGAATMLLMLAISAWLSRRLSRRIESVRALFGRIADGQFAHVDAQRPFDEVYDLVLSANRLVRPAHGHAGPDRAHGAAASAGPIGRRTGPSAPQRGDRGPDGHSASPAALSVPATRRKPRCRPAAACPDRRIRPRPARFGTAGVAASLGRAACRPSWRRSNASSFPRPAMPMSIGRAIRWRQASIATWTTRRACARAS